MKNWLKKCNIDIWLQAKFKFSSFALSQTYTLTTHTTPNRNIRFFYVTQLFLAPLVRLQWKFGLHFEWTQTSCSISSNFLFVWRLGWIGWCKCRCHWSLFGMRRIFEKRKIPRGNYRKKGRKWPLGWIDSELFLLRLCFPCFWLAEVDLELLRSTNAALSAIPSPTLLEFQLRRLFWLFPAFSYFYLFLLISCHCRHFLAMVSNFLPFWAIFCHYRLFSWIYWPFVSALNTSGYFTPKISLTICPLWSSLTISKDTF